MTIKTVNQVMETTNYGQFKISNINRKIEANLRLENEIAEMGILSPIIVNEDYVVIDGQHRLQSAMKLHKPIPYIMMRGAGKEEMISINTTNRLWKLIDFIESYHNDGFEEYTKLLDLIENRKVSSLSAFCVLAMNSFDTTQSMAEIKEGNFKFYNYNYFVDFLDEYERLKMHMSIKTTGRFMSSIYSLYRMQKFDINRLIKKSGLLSEKLKGITDLGITTRIMIEVYHHGLRISSPLAISHKIDVSGSVILKEDLKEEVQNKRVTNE